MYLRIVLHVKTSDMQFPQTSFFYRDETRLILREVISVLISFLSRGLWQKRNTPNKVTITIREA